MSRAGSGYGGCRHEPPSGKREAMRLGGLAGRVPGRTELPAQWKGRP